MSPSPRNIEIKAQVRHWARQISRAKNLSDTPAVILRQTDTFFRCPVGRLKLRQVPNQPAQLIAYHRPDHTEPSPSDYSIVATHDGATLRRILGSVLGIRGEVRKIRTLFRSGQTRIHFDDVSHLGFFIELEVVCHHGQSDEDAQKVALDLMEKLDIQSGDLVSPAYIDLLEAGNRDRELSR